MSPIRLLLPLYLSTTALFAEIPRPDDAPRPLSPEESAAAFQLPDGFGMEVVASEPLISSPSAVCWDARGRMFVSELHGYNLAGQLDVEELNKTGKLDTQVRRVQAAEKFKEAAKAGTFGVVKLLHDRDGDGRMDKAQTWASDLPPVYGLVPARDGVIVACAPDIVFLADRDGDGVAEVREVLFTGFRQGELERGINAPQWNVDGWIYFGRGWHGGPITGPKLAQPVALPDSDFRIRPDGSAIEPVTGGVHTFGFATTESGDRFVVTTTVPAIFIAPLPWRYLLRNPDTGAPSIDAETGDRRVYSIAPPHPWRQKRADDPAYFRFYRDQYGAAESEAEGWFTAVSGPLIYQDQTLPGLHGQYFACDPAGNLIYRGAITSNGPALEVRRTPGDEKKEFAASRDPWSHPINLSHGPDGAIWIVDYYREIIEDYSAIPRHLQQQYGLYAGHDRGRIYRLMHRDATAGDASDMSNLDVSELVKACASSLFWRRETAQRLLIERGDAAAVPHLRKLLAGETNSPSPTLIIALHTLKALDALRGDDLRPFVSHEAAAVRIHALQLADQRFSHEKNSALLDAILLAAAVEKDPRVLLQFALSLGETRDARAFAQLAEFARKHATVRWMDAALLSSLHGRGAEMLAKLLRETGSGRALLEPLAKSVAARKDKAELARAIEMLHSATPEDQALLLGALAKGLGNAIGETLADPAIRKSLTRLTESQAPEVRVAAAALLATFSAPIPASGAGATEMPVTEVSEARFREFVAALAAPRDLSRGHEVFSQACAVCHRIEKEGHEFGPDLIGELGVAEETLVRHILLPNERIRPGFETVQVETREGAPLLGLLKNDGATSLTLRLAGGAEQVVLRKDVTVVKRPAFSLMPSFAESITPPDMANLLGWLRSQLRPGGQPTARSEDAF